MLARHVAPEPVRILYRARVQLAVALHGSDDRSFGELRRRGDDDALLAQVLDGALGNGQFVGH
jgi:hypothetical protein